MKKIVVPIDFSDCSLNAVRYASSLAELVDAQLHIIYVHTPEVMVSAIPGWQPYYDILPLPEIIHEQMSSVKAVLKGKNIQVHTYIKEGVMNDAIIELTQQKHADLVVMGTEGINFSYSFLWGTNTAHLIAEKKVPVLVVPANYKGKPEPNAEFVFATDFKGLDFIPDFFIELTKTLHAKLHVFHDKKHTGHQGDNVFESQEYNYIKTLFSDSNVSLNYSYSTDLVHAVEEFIKKKHASLVVMIAHERGFLDNLFHKSVTKQMALHADIPFLAIPDEKAELSASISNSGFVG